MAVFVQSICHNIFSKCGRNPDRTTVMQPPAGGQDVKGRKIKKGERQGGIALASVLFLLVVLSLLAAGVLWATNLETISAGNYRAATDAFYFSDAGLQAAQQWFENNYTPAMGATYATNVTPVTYNGSPVVLDAMGGTSNYPTQSTTSAF
jgi:Tfp pilus assembly protein PilX